MKINIKIENREKSGHPRMLSIFYVIGMFYFNQQWFDKTPAFDLSHFPPKRINIKNYKTIRILSKIKNYNKQIERLNEDSYKNRIQL